jgi:geranylgeranyl reductase family protein
LQRNYDVIIVGAGPAGATLAYELVSRGIRVLILEKAALPRYKCCAGGLTIRAAKLLGINIDGVIDNAISSAVVTFAGANPYRGSFPEIIMYTVMREKFDYALVKRAEKAGADILEGLEAQEIHLNDTNVDVSTSAGNFRSQFVAGADGAKSIVARALGVERNSNNIVGIETEVMVADEELVRWKSQIAIDLGRIPSGYAWVFPKADHLSIGIACLADKAKDLKLRYWQFMKSLNFSHYTIARWDSSLLPFCTGQVVVARGRAILVGDAAGLADPLSGEGLHNAILSAQLAAPAMEKSLRCGEILLGDYLKSVEEKIIPEMKIAYVFSRVLAQFPPALFKRLEREERVWKGCCYMLRGEINYSTIKNKISTIGGLYNLVLRRFPIQA